MLKGNSVLVYVFNTSCIRMNATLQEHIQKAIDYDQVGFIMGVQVGTKYLSQ